MIETLEGGCKVLHPRDTRPLVHGDVHAWPLFGRATGAAHLSLRLLEFGPGSSPACTTPACDEVWYVLRGDASLLLNGRRHALGANTGVYVAPGSLFSVHNATPDPLVVLSARTPEPEEHAILGSIGRGPEVSVSEPKGRSHVVRLADRPEATSGERSHRVLVDAASGSQVTLFAGSIPPGRVPQHAHAGDEALWVIEGEGMLWAGASHAPVGPRTGIYLPRAQSHCIENTGRGVLLLAGVQHPAGDPGAYLTANDPD